jgi:hypothetical protein
MRSITPEEVANITQLWEPVHIINLDTRTLVGSVPRDVVAPNHMHGFSVKNRQTLTSIFEKAFASECKHVGFIAPDYLYDTMYNSALDVAEYNGGDWQVTPLERDEYADLINQARLKMLAEVAIEEEDAEILRSLESMEKNLCDAMGMDTKSIAELYMMDPDIYEGFKETFNETINAFKTGEFPPEIEEEGGKA